MSLLLLKGYSLFCFITLIGAVALYPDWIHLNYHIVHVYHKYYFWKLNLDI